MLRRCGTRIALLRATAPCRDAAKHRLWGPRQATQPVHLFSNKERSTIGGVPQTTGEIRAELSRSLHSMFSNKYWRSYVLFIFGTGCCVYTYLHFRMRWNAQLRSSPLLPPKRRSYKSRLTVVLDIDETLLSYGDKAYRLNATFAPRPYLAELLDYLVTIDAEVVVWSAASHRYNQAVLSVLDPAGVRVSELINRDASWFVDTPFYRKDAQWLGRDMRDLLMVENRAMSVAKCNNNSVLVEDFIRAEYMDTGRDFPQNDKALKYIKEIVQDLTDKYPTMSVPDYLADREKRHPALHSIPCHLAIRQLPDEIAEGEFHFVGNKYRPVAPAAAA